MTTIDLIPGLAGLAVASVLGVWVGYRWAMSSRKFDAILDRTLAQLDLTPEDEAPCRRPDPHPVCACLAGDPWSRAADRKPRRGDDDWGVESWWLK